jgi:transposase
LARLSQAVRYEAYGQADPRFEPGRAGRAGAGSGARAQQDEIDELKGRVEQLAGQVDQLSNQVDRLQRELSRAGKDSATSAKPPSSDITDKQKKPRSPSGSQRKKGGQPGHDKHDREPFAADAITHHLTHTLDQCPACGSNVTLSDNTPRSLQQVELIERPIYEVTEHTACAYWCEGCQQLHHAPMPTVGEAGGLFGPKLTAWVGYLKGACHCSYSTIQELLRDMLDISVSQGFLVKVIDRASQSLAPVHQALGEALPEQDRLNMDETGPRDEGQRMGSWCFRADDFTWFHIDPTRGAQVLWDTLGEDFTGVLGWDYFSAYRKYMGRCDVRVQFCLAHLIRDLRYLTTLHDTATQTYGQRLVKRVSRFFELIHQRETMSDAEFEAELAKARDAVLKRAIHRVPDTAEAHNIAKRFRDHGEAYFRFITPPGIEPTNNLAEQAIRFVVIDRRITQGTRGQRGQRWCERIWTLIATCRQQGRSIHQALAHAVHAHFHGRLPPQLAPS